MEFFRKLIWTIFHLSPKSLNDFTTYVGPHNLYVVLCLIIFAETGLVVTPFLPGDSLLFAAGALGATAALRMEVMIPLLVLAAVLGDAVNYAVGSRIAHRFLAADADETRGIHRLVKREHVARAHAFFIKHGGKAVVLARFVPIVRTFVPFVAGAAQMTTGSFVAYNAAGAIAWVSLCLLAGWFFGNIPVIKNNFSLVTIGIVFVSILPMLFELVAHRRRKP